MKTSKIKSEMRLATDLQIDFLYLDLTTCSRCCGTDKNLGAALDMLKPLLKAIGVKVQVRKTQVKSEAQARALGFQSSPTIRVNGRDIAGELRESQCGACSAACEVGARVNCRVWIHHGQDHTQAPVGLIVECILREIFGKSKPLAVTTPKARNVPANLKRYFTAAAPGCGCSAPRRIRRTGNAYATTEAELNERESS